MGESGTRALSLHERYSHVRSLLNIPHPITFLITLPPASSAASSINIDIDHLRQRAEYLQTVWPHLYARIEGARSNAPTWVPGERAWRGDEIVRSLSLPEGLQGAGEVIQWESRDFRAGRGSSAGLDGPGWRMTLYTSLPSAKADEQDKQNGQDGQAFLAFSVNHVLADGTGALRLFTALLSNEQYEPEDLPPALESTINIKPSLMTILPQVWTKLIRPKLPAWFQPRVDPDACSAWPGPLDLDGVSQSETNVSESSKLGGTGALASAGDDAGRGREAAGGVKLIDIGSTALPERIALFHLPASLTDSLKAQCKAHNTTLHPILKTAWTWAMFHVIDTDPSLTPLRTDGSARAYTLNADTPRNERNKDLGHGYATGNYVSGLEYVYTNPTTAASADGIARESRTFWETAQAVSEHLSESATIAAARQKFGSLAYIPNGPNDPSEPTGWEVFWDEQRHQAKPYGSAVSVSNLGYTSILSHLSNLNSDSEVDRSLSSPSGQAAGKEGESELYWMQPAVPWGDALAVNVMGSKAGLGVTVSFLEGAVLSEEQVERMREVFVRVLDRLSAGVERYEELVA